MNAKTLLTLLEDDFSDENVATAIAWLKKQKPTNKATNKILEKVFSHSAMVNELDWLSEWAKTNSWSFAFAYLQDWRNVSLRRFEYILRLLINNPTNPAAAELWTEVLRDFRHELLIPNAREWVEQCDLSDYDSQQAISALLEIDQTTDLIANAKQSLELNFNVFLLKSLIEHTSDQQLISVGKQKLTSALRDWEKRFILEALAQVDLEGSIDSIHAFFSEAPKDARPLEFMQELLEQYPRGVEIICDWMEINFNTPLAKELFLNTRKFFVNDDVAGNLWDWLKSKEITEQRFEIFIRLFETSRYPLPESSRELVESWLQSHPKHKIRNRVIKAFERTEEKSLGVRSGKRHTKVVALEASGVSHLSEQTARLIGIEHMDFDDQWLQITRFWLDQTPTRNGALVVATEIYQMTQKLEDLNRVKTALKHSDVSNIAWSLSQLSNLTDPELISNALTIVKTKRLYRKWHTQYLEVGTLMFTLLQKLPNNEEVRSAAREWVKTPPTWGGKKVYADICKFLAES